MNARAASFELVAGLDEVTVVVPFDVVDRVLREDREDLFFDVFVGFGDADVKDLLVA
jgi:hypothetical protein